MLVVIHRFLAFLGGDENFTSGIIIAVLITIAVSFGLEWLLYGKTQAQDRKKRTRFKHIFLSTLLSIGMSLLLLGPFMTAWELPTWLQNLLQTLFNTPALSRLGPMAIPVVFGTVSYILSTVLLSLIWTVKAPNKALETLSGILLPAFLGSMLFYLVFIGAVFALFIVPISCRDKQAMYHQFNAHLKNVCSSYNKTRTVDECPKNEKELEAFNPKIYRDIKSCVTTYYEYDQTSSDYTWITRWPNEYILISNPQMPEGFGGYSLKVPREDWDPEQYPPSTPGPWDKLPW